MNTFARFEHEQRRLAILRILSADPDYSTNEEVLAKALAASGLGASTADLRADLVWLRDQVLVMLGEVAGVYTVKLARRGEDVANGLERVEGVARPRPE